MGVSMVWKDSKYEVRYISSKGFKRQEPIFPSPDRYTKCKVIQEAGGTDIQVIRWEATVVDHYVQGHSARSFPSVPVTEQQLELF